MHEPYVIQARCGNVATELGRFMITAASPHSPGAVRGREGGEGREGGQANGVGLAANQPRSSTGIVGIYLACNGRYKAWRAADAKQLYDDYLCTTTNRSALETRADIPQTTLLMASYVHRGRQINIGCGGVFFFLILFG